MAFLPTKYGAVAWCKKRQEPDKTFQRGKKAGEGQKLIPDRLSGEVALMTTLVELLGQPQSPCLSNKFRNERLPARPRFR
jgi:hypothetical protein